MACPHHRALKLRYLIADGFADHLDTGHSHMFRIATLVWKQKAEGLASMTMALEKGLC